MVNCSKRSVLTLELYLPKDTDQRGQRSMGGDSQLFPVEDYRKVIQTILRRDGAAALEYGDPAGYLPLRSTVAHILSTQGIPARPENLLITAGSQQAIALVTQMLLRPGDAILV